MELLSRQTADRISGMYFLGFLEWLPHFKELVCQVEVILVIRDLMVLGIDSVVVDIFDRRRHCNSRDRHIAFLHE